MGTSARVPRPPSETLLRTFELSWKDESGKSETKVVSSFNKVNTRVGDRRAVVPSPVSESRIDFLA